MSIFTDYQILSNIRIRSILYIVAVLMSFSDIWSQDLSNIKKEDLYDISGNIGANLSFSDYGNSYSQQSPWSSVISAGLNLKLAGVDIPLSFAYVNGKSSYMHPFTRYGLSPKYKNYTLHLGYRSMNLSPSVFSGKTFYGIGTEVNYDNFRFALFYGEIEEARAYDTAFITRYPSYSRIAVGGKLGFSVGSFALDLSLLKAKDEPSSVSFPVNIPITPQDNLVAGISSRVSFLKYFNFSTDWAVSGHTKNINGDDIDDGAAKKYSGLFIVKANSTIGYTCNNNLGFNWNNFGVQLNHRQVSQDFQSLGIPNYGTNIRSSGINANIQLLDNKLSLSGFFVMQDNNLSKKQIMTTYTNSFGLNATANINERFNISGSYNGVYVNQKSEKELPQAESGKFNMFTHNINISPSYLLPANKIEHSFSLPIDFYITSMESDITKTKEESGNITVSPSYSVNLSEYDLQTGISYSFSSMISDTYTNSRHSVGINANKAFLEKKELSVNSSVNFGIDDYGGTGSNKNLVLSAGASYKLFEQHSFSINFNYSLGFSGSIANYETYRASLSYQWNIPSILHKKKKNN